jgi:hypothetical protein
MKLTNLYVWRNVCSAYLPLESFLSTQEIADECILCVDPEFGADMDLAYRLSDKLSKVRVIPYAWPLDAPGDGSRIGIASQYALDHVRPDTDYVLNVQADEIYPTSLTELLIQIRDYISEPDCISMKVLNLEHNMQQYQGGDEASTWDHQSGAGYNKAIKLFRNCPDIRFAHDGWSMEGCHKEFFLALSRQYPIVHAHDNFRDTLIALRHTAADEIWTDRERFGHYKQSANDIEASREQWWNDPKWTNTTAKFHELLPDYVKSLVGQTHYAVRWELLDEYLQA